MIVKVKWNGHLARFNFRAGCPNIDDRENEGEPKGGALRGDAAGEFVKPLFWSNLLPSPKVGRGAGGEG
ncbi:hypothetical protein [Moorena sp. SIO3I6]|uniref:hypothetical protein n=1 Tax=Moorena sp. SIO3I6 TaxID=2607831 RepID=UPI0013F885F0|nr:hypothetical protein [Moorena sp. SIO3I6]NEO51583.1 hypothetical protein [Moorena sp. SIO4A3]NEP29683.1 hypothetical protein [Moorena sp. SIO3I6]